MTVRTILCAIAGSLFLTGLITKSTPKKIFGDILYLSIFIFSFLYSVNQAKGKPVGNAHFFVLKIISVKHLALCQPGVSTQSAGNGRASGAHLAGSRPK
jgi:hypothetical protein